MEEKRPSILFAENGSVRIEHVEGVEQVEPLPPQEATWYMVIFIIFISLIGWIATFDTGSLMQCFLAEVQMLTEVGFGGIVLLMPPYNRAFGHCTTSRAPETGLTTEKCELTATQQSLISLTSLFIAVGGALAGFSGRYLGRRGTVLVGALLSAIGAGGMLGTTGSFASYLVCKCLGGIGIGHLMAVGPIYGVECTIASKRGFLMSSFNAGLALGNAIAASVCAGSAGLTTNLAWQIPIMCQIPLTLFLGIGVFFFPESPRWLLVAGQEDAARKSFATFYRKDPYSAAITHQIEEVKRYIEAERGSGNSASYFEIFDKNNRRRTLISILTLAGLALTGLRFVLGYCALFLRSVGITNPYLNNVIIALCVFAGAFPSPFIVEYCGRRFAMLLGYSCMGSCMLIFAAVAEGIGEASPIAKHALIAFLCLWAFAFGATVGPSVFIASAEMHAIRLRTTGQACAITIYEICAFAASFYTPYMLSADYGNMGSRVGFFYAGISALQITLVFLFIPETASLTLEQIDDYFASGRKAWRTSTRRNKLIAAGKLVEERVE